MSISLQSETTPTRHDYDRTADADKTAWVDGHREEITNFDFDRIDQALGFIKRTPADARAEAATLIAALLVWIWGSTGRVRPAMVRLAAITGGLRPDLLQDRTYKEIGEEIGCTRANISKAALKFQGRFGMKFARTRSEEGRKHMAAAMIGNTNKRRYAKRTQSKLP